MSIQSPVAQMYPLAQRSLIGKIDDEYGMAPPKIAEPQLVVGTVNVGDGKTHYLTQPVDIVTEQEPGVFAASRIVKSTNSRSEWAPNLRSIGALNYQA